MITANCGINGGLNGVYAAVDNSYGYGRGGWSTRTCNQASAGSISVSSNDLASGTKPYPATRTSLNSESVSRDRVSGSDTRLGFVSGSNHHRCRGGVMRLNQCCF